MDYTIKIKEFPDQLTASIRVKTTLDKVSAKVSQLLGEAEEYLAAEGVKATGPGFGIYYEVGAFLVDVEVGYPVGEAITGNDRVKPGTLNAIKAATCLHNGLHRDMPEAHRAVHAWMHDHEVEASGEPAREVYLSDLSSLSEQDQSETESVWPVTMETRAERRRKSRAS